MLIRIVRMTFRPEERQNFLTLFDEKKEKIRHFPGCTHLELLEDYNDPNIFSTYSYWDSEADLNNYRHSDLFAEVWANTKSKFAAKPIAFSLKNYIKVD
ncbi:putative quinol monooxygenase [Roseivirga misakiensis]|uniref:Antibiotic biosynthesis monooxygenase n=1 Tax=Roseivirga misakiensis TaxID=1563681 RepID=A0A1E5T286_9BACT|nr:antibiotic biosynthesis monooxygenase family protein [Roseivirga misakiensis]OEK05492.1 antibiotic biosynthesis monooxygenase [Roseivirga misakiensis]